MRMYRDNKQFYKSLFAVALPIMAQNLLTSSVSFLDTLMIGQLGAKEIAAVGVANQIFFLVNLFIFGITSSASIFLARYYGAKEYKKMQKVIALGLCIAVSTSFLWTMLSLFLPDKIMLLFTNDPDIIAFGVEYQLIVAVSYMFVAITFIYSAGFRSINNARMPLYTSIISILLNALGNYILIFGIGPFPTLGVKGAAIATLIARFIEMVLLIYLTKRNKAIFAIKDKSSFYFEKDFIVSYIKISLPVIINEMIWALGVSLYKVAYSDLGTDTLASINISESISNFFFVASSGFGNAATIVLGQIIGRGEDKEAIFYGKKSLILALLTGAVMGVLLFLLSPFFTSLFNVNENIIRITILTMYVNAFCQPIKSFNMMLLVGVLRAGGDTLFVLITEIFAVWGVGVSAAFIGASWLGLPIYIVYALVALEEVVKSVIAFVRFRKNNWIKRLSE